MSDEKLREYIGRVLAGSYPKDPRVPLPTRHVNGAGDIQNVILGAGFGCVSVIRTEARQIRSNHYHRADYHFLYVLEGSMLYFERPIGSKELPEPQWFGPGQMAFTPPHIEHATAFPEKTILVSISKRPRDTRSHESDLVRVPFLAPENLGW